MRANVAPMKSMETTSIGGAELRRLSQIAYRMKSITKFMLIRAV